MAPHTPRGARQLLLVLAPQTLRVLGTYSKSWHLIHLGELGNYSKSWHLTLPGGLGSYSKPWHLIHLGGLGNYILLVLVDHAPRGIGTYPQVMAPYTPGGS